MAKIQSVKLSDKRQKDGKREILVRLYISREYKPQLRTEIYVKEKCFVCNAECCVIVPPEGKRNASDVQEARHAYRQYQNFKLMVGAICDATEQVHKERLTREFIVKAKQAMELHGILHNQVTYDRICELLTADDVSKAKYTFTDYAKLFLENKKPMSQGMKAGFKVVFRSVCRYEAYRKATENANYVFDVEKVTYEDIEDYVSYIRNEHDLQSESPNIFNRVLMSCPNDTEELRNRRKVLLERGQNTIINMVKRLRAFFTWLRRDKKYIKNNPFIDMAPIGSEDYGTPYFITIDERNKIANMDLSSNRHLEIQRDIFIFQCFTGCRVSDLMTLTEDNITDNILEYVPIKTRNKKKRVQPRIPLSPKAKELVENYRGIDRKGRLFPFISSQQYNYAIKKIMTRANITRNVLVRNTLTGETECKPINEIASSHMARRTFVGNLYFKVQDPNIIGKMSGHIDGSRAFARYRDIGDDILKNTINLIE